LKIASQHLKRLAAAYDEAAAEPGISEQLRCDIIATKDAMLNKLTRKPKKPKRLSKGQRWSDAASAAIAALEELRAVQEEFEAWKDNLPENLQASVLGEKLEAICDLDIEGALSTIQDAESADIPLGFGRD
jgi:hypothetical protein